MNGMLDADMERHLVELLKEYGQSDKHIRILEQEACQVPIVPAQ